MNPPAIAIALLTRANAYERGDLSDTSPTLLRDASGAISALLASIAAARDQRDRICREWLREVEAATARVRAALAPLETEK